MPEQKTEPEQKTDLDEAHLESGMFETAPTATARELRERALREARQRALQIPENLSGLSLEDSGKLLHELRVHQIELELQNEELRRAQEELEVSRGRYFDLYDLAPVGYLTIGEKGTVLEANLTLAGLLDMARSELVKQPWTRFICNEDQDVYFKHRKRLFSSGAPDGCEMRLVKSNGQTVWVRLEARVAQGADGTRVCRTAVSDVSARKCVEETLQASEARHRILFERSPDALLTLAPRGWSVTSANAAGVAMFGARDEADLVSWLPGEFSPERQADGRPSAERLLAMVDVAAKEGRHSFDWIFIRRPGMEFRATLVLVQLHVNGTALLEATVRDETAIQNIRAASAQTERLASMGMLAASVGHEINNPLAYVLSNIESVVQVLPKLTQVAARCRALRDVVGGPAFVAIVGEHAELLEPAVLAAANEQALDALEGAQRITRISRMLNTFARVDSTELHTVDLQLAIESAISMASNEIALKAKLVEQFSPVHAVWGAAGKLSQVFLNLLINAAHAIDANQQAAQTITVRTWSEGSNVFAEVRDTGNGIAAENIEQVFEPFFSTKGVGKGSGLGLSICRKILAEFGGDIRVESELGAGTRFVVRLWAGVEAPLLPETELPSRMTPLTRGRILVVDDEEPLRRLMARLLAEHEVVTVGSGQEARDLLEHDQAFDLILCDLMMPGMSGMDLHRWLTSQDAALARRMVFVTGGASGPNTGQSPVNTENLLIQKPFERGAFTHAVTEQVLKAKSEPPGAAARPRK